MYPQQPLESNRTSLALGYFDPNFEAEEARGFLIGRAEVPGWVRDYGGVGMVEVLCWGLGFLFGGDVCSYMCWRIGGRTLDYWER